MSTSMTYAANIVTPQGANSSTWRAPRLDDGQRLPELVLHHLEHSATHLHAVMPSGRTLSTGEALRAAHRAGRTLLGAVEGAASNRIVGILAEPETLLVSAVILGAICADLIPLVISPRNPAAAITNLCKKTDCRVLFVSSKPVSLSQTAKDALLALEKENVAVKMVPMPAFEAVFPAFTKGLQPEEGFGLLPLPTKRPLDTPMLILHSSGSTSLPKPIPWSHEFVTKMAAWFWFGKMDVCGRQWFSGMVPTFHTIGIGAHILFPLSSGLVTGCFDPDEPSYRWPPSVQQVIQAVGRTKAQDILVFPSMLEQWLEDERAIDILRSCGRVAYSGGPLSREVGDKLVERGVKLSQIWGTTEVAYTMEFQENPGRDWMYFRRCPHANYRLRPVGNEGLHVLHILSTPFHKCAVVNLEGEDGFDTNDLAERHPTDPDLYRVVSVPFTASVLAVMCHQTGRADALIVLTNGEKVNPEPMELTLQLNAVVHKAIVFGRGRPSVGAILELSAKARELTHQEILSHLRPDLDAANASASTHSRIFDDLVLFSDPRRPFELTPKGTVQRQKMLTLYAKEIDEAYARLDAAPTAATNGQLDGSDVSKLVCETFHVPSVDDNANLFAMGCDSLQATYLQRRLSKLSGRRLPVNLVYQYPTIASLSRCLQQAQTDTETSSKESHVAAMTEAVRRFSANLPARSHMNGAAVNGAINGHQSSHRSAILVTGTTGALGSQLLASLLSNLRHERVYALVRAMEGSNGAQRQLLAFKQRGLDTALLSSPRLTLLEGDLARANLGLDSHVLQEFKASLKCLIHAAWRVNFNFPLSGFDGDLTALRHLVDLAVSCMAKCHFVFTSSIATVTHWSVDDFAPERLIGDPLLAAGQGYDESKYVADEVLKTVARQCHLPVTTIRIGQVAGSTSIGEWTTSEWFPSVVKSSQALGCFPDGKDVVAWVPVDVVGRVLEDIACAPCDGFRCLNLAHPRPAPWTSIAKTISQLLDVPLVPFPVWLQKLEASAASADTDLSTNPALLLLDLFRRSTMAQVETPAAKEALGYPRLATDRAQSLSPTLRDLPPLSAEDARRYVQRWHEIGFLDGSSR